MIESESNAGAAAAARRELDRQLELLSALVRRADSALHTLLPVAHEAGWQGPANWAFEAALAALKWEATTAVAALKTAQRLTEAALYEAESGV